MTTLPPNRDQSRADENVVLDTRGLCDLAHRAWGTLIPRRHRDLLESSGTPLDVSSPQAPARPGLSLRAECMSSEHFGQLAWQFKRMSGSSGLKVQAAIAC